MEDEKKETETKLEDVHKIFNKWLYIEDENRIDLILAIYLTKQLNGTPIWLILVGNSGDGKTEQILSLKNCEDIFLLHNLTPKTLITGKPKTKDLAPELHNKVVIIPDLAQLLQLSPQDKGEIWSQLRDLYDGFAGKNLGTGTRTRYEGLRITLLACSTPKIDSQILIHQDLGTRELIYRSKDFKDSKKLMRFALDNEEKEQQMKQELKDITTNFLKNKKIKETKLTTEEEETIEIFSEFLAITRATAEYDSYTNEIRTEVYPERPTRIIKQLKRIFIALSSLEENYDKKKALSILFHIARSSANPLRIKILDYIMDYQLGNEENPSKNLQIDNKGEITSKPLTVSNLSRILLNGKRSIQRELYILWNLKILNKKEDETSHTFYPTQEWTLNMTDSFVKKYYNFIKKNPYLNKEENKKD